MPYSYTSFVVYHFALPFEDRVYAFADGLDDAELVKRFLRWVKEGQHNPNPYVRWNGIQLKRIARVHTPKFLPFVLERMADHGFDPEGAQYILPRKYYRKAGILIADCNFEGGYYWNTKTYAFLEGGGRVKISDRFEEPLSKLPALLREAGMDPRRKDAPDIGMLFAL